MSQSTSRDAGTAKERILNAALMRFSCQSYDSTSLREIASDAMVDVSYVHRAFGSKIRLFQDVLHTLVARDGPAEILSVPRAELPQYLARQVVTSSSQTGPGRMGAFEIAMQSSTSPEARAAVLHFVENDFLEHLTRKLGHEDSARAVLITALLAGVDIMRSAVGSRSATTLDSAWLQDSIARMITYAAEMPPPPPDRTEGIDGAAPAEVKDSS